MIRWSSKQEWDATWDGERGENNPPDGIITIVTPNDLTLPPDRVSICP